jgi:DAK2 domain fusion protein YloV
LTEHIDGENFKEMIANASAVLARRRNEINELNVFPVPDGDTGTNMSLTIKAGAKALGDAAPGTIGRAADIAANALLRGARGNSGVILSLLFRGMARQLKDSDAAGAAAFALALKEGVDSAYKAVMKPAEGTILTVSRVVAAEAVALSGEESDIELILERALALGYKALAETTEQNPVLKKAGVVDAGAKGYLYILDGMLKALRGEIVEWVSDSAESSGADFTEFDTANITFTYCTEFIAERRSPKEVNLLRDLLDARGDSIVVVDDDEIVKVHVHTNEPGAVLTEALTFGPLLSVKIENMREQHTQKLVEAAEVSAAPAAAASPVSAPRGAEKRCGVVAVCAGEGLAAVFRDLGVDNIITGGQTMNPSTEDILGQIEATPAELVFVLPNNKNIIMAAEQTVPLSGKKVIVIPTTTIPQGISAMLTYDPDEDEAVNRENMTQALPRVRTALITYAARDSDFDGNLIKAGEYLALSEGSLIANSPDFAEAAGSIIKSFTDISHEFVTVYCGEDAAAEETDDLVRRIAEQLPDAEVTVLAGGQPVYRYIFSAE